MRLTPADSARTPPPSRRASIVAMWVATSEEAEATSTETEGPIRPSVWDTRLEANA